MPKLTVQDEATYQELAKNWVKGDPKPRASRLPERKTATAADRRNYANKLAGWPVKGT